MTSIRANRRQQKWAGVILEILEAGPEEGMIFTEIQANLKNLNASREWIRKRLIQLETDHLIWWNPLTRAYTLYPTRASR